MSPDEIRRWRDEATEDIERIDRRRGRTPRGGEHVDALLRPKLVRIQSLADALLDRDPG